MGLRLRWRIVVPAVQAGLLSDICACPRSRARAPVGASERGWWCGCRAKASGWRVFHMQKDPDETLGDEWRSPPQLRMDEQRIHSRMVAGFHVSVGKYCHAIARCDSIQNQFMCDLILIINSRKPIFPKKRSISLDLPSPESSSGSTTLTPTA